MEVHLSQWIGRCAVPDAAPVENDFPDASECTVESTMKQHSLFSDESATSNFPANDRSGAMLVFVSMSLVVLLAAVALSVDAGYIALERSRLQNAADAAALAAAEEICATVRSAPVNEKNPSKLALERAREVAQKVAALGGVYIDPARDLEFGSRIYSSASNQWETAWGTTVSNSVRVTARRDNETPNQPDSKLKLFFGVIWGKKNTDLRADAVATVKPRDMVVVHDFSRSMNYDSYFTPSRERKVSPPRAEILRNMQLLWEDLRPTGMGRMRFEPEYLRIRRVNSGIETSLEYRGTSTLISTRGATSLGISEVHVTYRGSPNSASATETVAYPSETGGWPQNVTLPHPEMSWVTRVTVVLRTGTSANSAAVGSMTEEFFPTSPAGLKEAFAIGEFPYAKGKQHSQNGSQVTYDHWQEFINHATQDEQMIKQGYQYKFGGITLINHVLRHLSSHQDTPELSKARHYPFTAVKEGHSLLCNYLQRLAYDDRIGMVSYDNDHRIEVRQVARLGVPAVDISDRPITFNYQAVNDLMRFKQANHYSQATNMGGGLKDAKSLLDNHRRKGTQGTILLMTDGNSNRIDRQDSGATSLPQGWSWNTLLDYDKDGAADYRTDDPQKTYVLRQAYKAVQSGYVINTIAVGADADTELLKAISWMSGGLFLYVPGGDKTTEMEEQLLEAFRKIAILVPPAELVSSEL